MVQIVYIAQSVRWLEDEKEGELPSVDHGPLNATSGRRKNISKVKENDREQIKDM